MMALLLCPLWQLHEIQFENNEFLLGDDPLDCNANTRTENREKIPPLLPQLDREIETDPNDPTAVFLSANTRTENREKIPPLLPQLDREIETDTDPNDPTAIFPSASILKILGLDFPDCEI